MYESMHPQAEARSLLELCGDFGRAREAITHQFDVIQARQETHRRFEDLYRYLDARFNRLTAAMIGVVGVVVAAAGIVVAALKL